MRQAQNRAEAQKHDVYKCHGGQEVDEALGPVPGQQVDDPSRVESGTDGAEDDDEHEPVFGLVAPLFGRQVGWMVVHVNPKHEVQQHTVVSHNVVHCPVDYRQLQLHCRGKTNMYGTPSLGI